MMVRKSLLLAAIIGIIASNVMAQNSKALVVPAVVKAALVKKYPGASKVSWETEKGNYEAEIKGMDLIFDINGNFLKKD